MSFLSPRGTTSPVATVVTIVSGALGGALFALAGLPAAWLSGSLIVVTTLALVGYPVSLPEPLRRAVFIVLGISMGTAVTPETIAGMWNWPITLALLVLSLPVTMAGVVLYLRWAGWERDASLYASAPGALSAVLALAYATGADVRKVAFAQSSRVFFLIAALPGTLALLGMSAPGPVAAAPWFAFDSGWDLLLMAVFGIAGGLIADRFGVPGGLIIGAMLASAVLHGSGYVTARLPQLVLVPCFVALGAFIGVRFVGTDFKLLRRLFVHSLGAFVVAVAICAAFALVAALAAGEELGKTTLAFAPGALEAMIILAFLLDLDPAFVGAHHLLRFLLIALCLPFVARAWIGRIPGNGGGGGSQLSD
ncbi:MAG: AbrB family transcriptional regulator [Bradyrhizobiaceae bacterium]|nr:AbrB family transcriptional regulator [Bradyrhizobiaceae bacterium]